MFNVLFVCIGNSCRSQMAEGFARSYGSDVLEASSAGISPAAIVQPETVKAMSDKNIDILDQFPKSLYDLDLTSFDVIVNMSGHPLLAGIPGEVLTWTVTDPMTQPEEVYVEVRDKLETLVMQLIMNLRRALKNKPPEAAPPAKPVRPQPGGPAKPAATPQRFGFGRIRPSRD